MKVIVKIKINGEDYLNEVQFLYLPRVGEFISTMYLKEVALKELHKTPEINVSVYFIMLKNIFYYPDRVFLECEPYIKKPEAL